MTPTKLRTPYVSALLIASALAACGDDATATPMTDAGPVTDLGTTADLGATPADMGALPGLRTLASLDWTVPPMNEKYFCVLVTIPDEIFVSEFHPVIPVGTHHTVLTFAPDGAGPDGTAECDGFTNGPRMIYGSGLGTNPLIFPEGVAVRIPAGSRLLLNLHLFNFDTTPLSGTSAVQARVIDGASIEHEAEMTLAGKDVGLVVAPRTVSEQTGTCDVTANTTLFALFPHMHQTGMHQRVQLLRGSDAPVILMDEDYTFDEQYYRNIAPGVALVPGDRIEVTCTYDNPGEAISFGESTAEEMCYSGIYVYPAGNFFTTCTN